MTRITPDAGEGLLASILGPQGCLDGAAGRRVLAPASTAQLRELVSAARRMGVKLALEEAAESPFGVQQAHGAVAISVARMRGILELDRKNLTARVGAGITFAALDDALSSAGVRWPVRPFPGHSTLASTLVTGLALVRSSALPDPRHWLLGGTMVLGAGESVTTGGRTIKNSAGYDLSRAMVGMMGRAAIPAELELRLLPAPERTESAFLELAGAGAALALLELLLQTLETAESLELSFSGAAGLGAEVRIAGADRAVDRLLSALQGRFPVGGGGPPRSPGLESMGRAATGGLIAWRAGPAGVCESMARLARSAPSGAAAVAYPFARKGFAAGPDLGALQAAASEAGFRAEPWPPGGERTGGPLGILRRALDPDLVLV